MIHYRVSAWLVIILILSVGCAKPEPALIEASTNIPQKMTVIPSSTLPGWVPGLPRCGGTKNDPISPLYTRYRDSLLALRVIY